MAWQRDWLQGAAPARRELWRGVEAQHRVATLRLVDDLDEQHLLEQLLEDSKPVLPPEAADRHYLVFTPFRYASPWPSRFRRPGEPGAWYGADEPRTVAAELAHWRWKFFMDSDGLLEMKQVVTEHTFFQASFAGTELDLAQPPWNAQRARWRHPEDYSQCHELAAQVRACEPPVHAIRYESARREGAMCEVVFAPENLALRRPHLQQTWTCKTTASLVLVSHDAESYQFGMG